MAFVTSAPELSVGGERARQTCLVALAPELSVGSEGAYRTGMVALTPGLSVGGPGVVGKLTITVEMISVLAPLMIDNVIVNYER